MRIAVDSNHVWLARFLYAYLTLSWIPFLIWQDKAETFSNYDWMPKLIFLIWICTEGFALGIIFGLIK